MQGADLFKGNYPPHILRPNKPRHNRTNIRAIFLAYCRTKQNPVFIYFYCTLFIIHWTGGNFVDTFRHFVDYYLRGVCPLYYIWDIIKHNTNTNTMRISKTQQIAQLKKEVKKFNLLAVLFLALLFVIPFLPIHVLGTGILLCFSFSACIAFACEATQKDTEAREMQKRLEWSRNWF